MRTYLLAAVFAAPSLLAQTPDRYQITHTYALGGEGGWDYVTPDPPRHRVFIGRQNRVMVVDTRTGKLIGEVPNIHGAHGVALDMASHHGFATSGNDSSVVMFDPESFRLLGRIPAAEDADALTYDAVSKRVFTFNGDAHNATVIDPVAGKFVRNIPLGGKPESGVAAGDGKLYVNLVDNAEVVEIDGRTMTVTRRWPTAPCAQPVAMAIDVQRRRLFSGCRSGVMAVSDYVAGKIVATVPIGSGVDGAGYDPVANDVFTSNADGTLSVIHQDGADRYHLLETVTTAPASRNLGFDPTTRQLFLPSAKFGPRPDSSAANPRRRPPLLPGSFALLVVERTAKP